MLIGITGVLANAPPRNTHITCILSQCVFHQSEPRTHTIPIDPVRLSSDLAKFVVLSNFRRSVRTPNRPEHIQCQLTEHVQFQARWSYSVMILLNSYYSALSSTSPSPNRPEQILSQATRSDPKLPHKISIAVLVINRAHCLGSPRLSSRT